MATDFDRMNSPPPIPLTDPGGSHAKGYSADGRQTPDDLPDPVPLAEPPRGAKVHPPDENQPTGRGEEGHGLILPEGG